MAVGNGPVLVSGAGSGVGSSIACSLASLGYSVIASYRSLTSDALRLREFPGITLLQGDLLDDSYLTALPSGIGAVVHCAAATDGKAVSELVDVNVLGMRRLLRHLERGSCRTWVQISTVSVHGEVNGGYLNRDSGFINPSPYGHTKRTSELILEQASVIDSVHCLRLPSVLAPRAQNHWLARVIASVQRGDPVTVFNPSSPFNNTIHIDDVSSLVSGLVGEAHSGYDAYPVASRTPVAVIDVVRRIIELMGSPSTLSMESSGAKSFTIDDSHARESYGYQSRTTIEALEDYIRRFCSVDPGVIVNQRKVAEQDGQ
jgi:nucleoside-diphosphate-sugar epimerase